LVGSAVGLEIVGDSERKSDWVGGEEGGGSVGVDSFGIGSGESLAEYVLLRRGCQFLSTGVRRGAAFKVGGRCFGCVGWKVGRCGGKGWWFGFFGVGSFRSEKMPAWSCANARSIASSE